MAAAAPLLYELEAVVGERGRGRHRELWVRWVGWRGQPDELTWEPAASVRRQVPVLFTTCISLSISPSCCC